MSNNNSFIANSIISQPNPIVTEKKCSKCKDVKLLSEFRNDDSNNDGLYSWCKKCHNDRQRELKHSRRTLPKEGHFNSNKFYF